MILLKTLIYKDKGGNPREKAGQEMGVTKDSFLQRFAGPHVIEKMPDNL